MSAEVSTEASTEDYELLIVREIERTISGINEKEIRDFVEKLLAADRIFVVGAGRSLLMMRAFAMRLMHLGLTAYVVGDTVTPAITDRDALVIGSGSGETEGLLAKARKAKAIGSKVLALTIYQDSSIGKIADHTVVIPGATTKITDPTRKSKQPGGSLFEQSLLIVLDGVVMRIVKRRGLDSGKPLALHANLE